MSENNPTQNTRIPRPQNAMDLFVVFSEPGAQEGETKVGIAVNPEANPKMLAEVLKYALQQIMQGSISTGQQTQGSSQNEPIYPTLTELIRD